MSPKQQAAHAKQLAKSAAAAQKNAANLQAKASAAQTKADQKTSAAAAYGVAAAASNTKAEAVPPDNSGGSPTSATIVAAPLNQGIQIGNGFDGSVTVNDTAPLTQLAQSSQDALSQAQQQSAATIATLGDQFASAAASNADAAKQTPASVWIGLAGLVLTAAYYLGGKK